MLNARTFTISRLTRPAGEDSSSKKRAYVATGAGITGFLSGATPDVAAIADGEYGKTFVLSADDFSADLRIGDRLTDNADAAEYDVKGVLKNTDGPGRRLTATLTLAITQ